MSVLAVDFYLEDVLKAEMIQMASCDLFYLRFPEHPWSKVMEKVAKMMMA
jgi:hypothetical protein